MERMTDADPDDRVAYWRADNVTCADTEDTDLTDRIDEVGEPTTDPSGLMVDRRDREHVAYYLRDGAWKPTALKRGDHVVCAQLPLIVIGPARGRDYFLGYYEPWFGDLVIPIEAFYIDERAPEDVNETPMPIIPEPEVTP